MVNLPRAVRRSGILLVVAFALGTTGSAWSQDIFGKARVIDGDTIVVAGKRIHIFGIDAPEKKQFCKQPDGHFGCGLNAGDAMKKFVTGDEVKCRRQRSAKEGGIFAVCYANGTDVGAKMVRAGWALAYKRQSKRYLGAEANARKNQRGIWASSFVPPWDWRAGKRKVSK